MLLSMKLDELSSDDSAISSNVINRAWTDFDLPFFTRETLSNFLRGESIFCSILYPLLFEVRIVCLVVSRLRGPFFLFFRGWGEAPSLLSQLAPNTLNLARLLTEWAN